LTVLEVFILGHHDPPSTERIQQLATTQTTYMVPQKLLKPLNKHLLMVTFEKGENNCIRLDSKFRINGLIFDLIRNEKNHCSHNINRDSR